MLRQLRPALPYRLAVMWQRGQATDVDALGRRMEVRPARGLETEGTCEVGKLAVFGGMVAAGDDFDTLAAERAKGVKQQVQLARIERVAARMRDHRHAATRADPVHGVIQRDPFVFDVARDAAREEALERAAHVGRVSLRHQPARKMRAPHYLLVDGVVIGTFVGAGDAGFCQIVAHAAGALDAPQPDASETGCQFGVRGVDAQTDDVYGLLSPTYRDFDARDQRHP